MCCRSCQCDPWHHIQLIWTHLDIGLGNIDEHLLWFRKEFYTINYNIVWSFRVISTCNIFQIPHEWLLILYKKLIITVWLQFIYFRTMDRTGTICGGDIKNSSINPPGTLTVIRKNPIQLNLNRTPRIKVVRSMVSHLTNTNLFW